MYNGGEDSGDYSGDNGWVMVGFILGRGWMGNKCGYMQWRLSGYENQVDARYKLNHMYGIIIGVEIYEAPGILTESGDSREWRRVVGDAIGRVVIIIICRERGREVDL